MTTLFILWLLILLVTLVNRIFISFKTCSWLIFNINWTTVFSPSHNEELKCTLELLHIAAELIVILCSLLPLPYYPQVNYAGYHTALGPTSTWMQSKYWVSDPNPMENELSSPWYLLNDFQKLSLSECLCDLCLWGFVPQHPSFVNKSS